MSDPVTASPRWGPRGQGPSKNRQGAGKNNWTIHVKNRKRPNGNPVLCVPWRLEQTAESHSLLSRLSRAWPPSSCSSGPRLQSVSGFAYKYQWYIYIYIYIYHDKYHDIFMWKYHYIYQRKYQNYFFTIYSLRYFTLREYTRLSTHLHS